MKKSLLIILTMLILTPLLMAVSDDNVLIITVEEAHVRSSPSAFSQILTTVYTDNQVTLVEKDEFWMKVIAKDGTEGWLNTSAVEEREAFTSYEGDVVTFIATTSAAMKSSEKGKDKSIKNGIYVGFKKSKKDINFKLLESLDKSQRQLNPFIDFSQFREDGNLGEFK